MYDQSFHTELERRLELLESPGTDESFLVDLPRRDILVAILTLTMATVLLVLWGYPA